MENQLVFTTFNVETKFFSYPARFVAPTWAQGFECKSGLCGYCCILATPDQVLKKPSLKLGRSVCEFYDAEKRLCQRYSKRPFTCRMYPFLFGVENGQVLVSTSLDCPGTNTRSLIQTDILLELFQDERINEIVTLLNDRYERAVLTPWIWSNADYVWEKIKNEVRHYFSRKVSFPFLFEVTTKIFETCLAPNHILKEISHASFLELAKICQGLHISTTFDSYKIFEINIKDSETAMKLFNNDLVETKIKTPNDFSELEIDIEAQSLLRGYIALLCNRPFLSLAACIATATNYSVLSYLPNIFSGCLMPLEIGATLISCRDKIDEIDRDRMREIIGFTESMVLSTFRRPDMALP